jgi:hypothetical protein
LGKCNTKDDEVASFMTVYELTQNEAPSYNPEDFQGYEWVMPEDLLTKIESGAKAKSDLPKLVRKFYRPSHKI